MRRGYARGLALLGLSGWLGLPALADAPLRLVDLEGQPVELRAAPGETLFVHFWATWCHSCVEELPVLQRVAAECADGPARVVTVNAGDEPDAVARFIALHRIELPALHDPRGRVWRDVSGEGLPVNLVLGPRGARRTELGPRSEADWRQQLAGAGCGVAAPPDPPLLP